MFVFLSSIHAETPTLNTIDNNISATCYLGITQDTMIFKNNTKWNGWGEELKLPKYFIKDLKIVYKQETLYIPISAFIDLGNPQTIKIKNTKINGCFHIEICGGDASTSYKAVLIFENMFIKKRIVKHLEFPETSWEKTEYHFTTEEY